RARSDSPNVAALRAISQQLADGALRAFTFSPLVASFCLELIFDRLPVQPEDERTADALLYRLLTEPRCPAELEEGGVRARRLPLAEYLFLPGDVRRVRLRFLYGVGRFEKARLTRHLRDKIAKE